LQRRRTALASKMTGEVKGPAGSGNNANNTGGNQEQITARLLNFR
jgi:hypothetical protein